MKPIQIGGVEDHVHVLLGAPPTLAPSKIAQLKMGGSSAWIHDTFPALRQFGWQEGYGAFTVSKSNLPGVTTYIQDQRKHHQTSTFEEEYVESLRKHEVDFDERYVFD